LSSYWCRPFIRQKTIRKYLRFGPAAAQSFPSLGKNRENIDFAAFKNRAGDVT
jgi:hypothetical protein